jgi:phospholipase/carboxylesterase
MIHTTQFDYELILARKPLKKLVVVLHGRGDSVRPFRNFDEELRVPGMNYLLLNGPRRWAGGYSWYGFPPRQAPGLLRTRKKLFKMMAELEKQGWKPEDIFFIGFSSGALVTVDFLLNYKKPIAGAIGVSGYVYFFKNWRKTISKAAFKTPWLMTHGTKDYDLTIEETRQDVAKLKSAGLKIQWEEFDKGHVFDEKKELPFLKKWILKRI